MNGKQIDGLLADVKVDKERIKKSIQTILQIYNLKLGDVSVYRRELDPSEIFVAATEECNIEDAKEILKEKYSRILPAPITVLKFRGKYVLFMGSNRGIIFVLKGKKPDCIVVKIPDAMNEPSIISEARKTLRQIIREQKHQE